MEKHKNFHEKTHVVEEEEEEFVQFSNISMLCG
jgi:hypothetical protein